MRVCQPGPDARQRFTTSGGKLRAYWELGKPRLSALAVFAVIAGAYMAWPAKGSHPPLDLLISTTLGTFLCAVGSGALAMRVSGLARKFWMMIS